MRGKSISEVIKKVKYEKGRQCMSDQVVHSVRALHYVRFAAHSSWFSDKYAFKHFPSYKILFMDFRHFSCHHKNQLSES